MFINTNSKTLAGGVGLYLPSKLEFTRRRKQLKFYFSVEQHSENLHRFC